MNFGLTMTRKRLSSSSVFGVEDFVGEKAKAMAENEFLKYFDNIIFTKDIESKYKNI